MAERDTDAESREAQREFRRVLAQALTEVRSNEVRTSFASVTLNELIDQHIDRLAESTDPWMIPRLQQVQKIRRELTDVIAKVKEMDPSEFREPEPDRDANTSVEGGT